MTIVSYSEVFKWQTCHRQYYYRFILGLSPEEESSPINIGVQGHKLLQNFHELLNEGKTKEESLRLVTQTASKAMMKEKKTDTSVLTAWISVHNYIQATDFTAKAILIENRFLIRASLLTDDPALSHVQIGFTPDVVFERKGGFLDVEDYKFVGRAWSAAKMNRFPQLKLYHIFLKKMGYNISRSTLRFFDIKQGKSSEKNYTLSPDEESILIHDFMEGVKEIAAFKDAPTEVHFKATRTMNYTACQFCSFEFPCSLEAKGKDASKTLSTQYKKSDYDYSK